MVETLVSHLPKSYRRVDIIADTYSENSLKNNERDSRGVPNKVIIRSASSRIPRNFTTFFSNGDNKTRLIELMKDELIKSSQEMLELLSGKMIYFSLDGVCLKITRDTAAEERNCQVIKKKQTQSCYSKPAMFYIKVKIKMLSYGHHQETWILIFSVWQCFLCRLKECRWTMELVIIVTSLS